ncbi:hypothetical protein E4U19_001618 [Claviceps sp. Clav32 group G5]|nr:hypothetical protein E4U19_001618 [Claviceps sp. Clav32 group G5]KAG6046903.1 hypothetical protein E4U39_000930 [Claviceps sp. Clav50 group G5]
MCALYVTGHLEVGPLFLLGGDAPSRIQAIHHDEAHARHEASAKAREEKGESSTAASNAALVSASNGSTNLPEKPESNPHEHPALLQLTPSFDRVEKYRPVFLDNVVRQYGND